MLDSLRISEHLLTNYLTLCMVPSMCSTSRTWVKQRRLQFLPLCTSGVADNFKENCIPWTDLYFEYINRCVFGENDVCFLTGSLAFLRQLCMKHCESLGWVIYGSCILQSVWHFIDSAFEDIWKFHRATRYMAISGFARRTCILWRSAFWTHLGWWVFVSLYL